MTVATVVHISDRVDVAAWPVLVGALESVREVGAEKLIVSLTERTQTDSVGYMLIDLHRRFGSRLMVVVPAKGACRRFLTASGLALFIRCETSLSAALAEAPVPTGGGELL